MHLTSQMPHVPFDDSPRDIHSPSNKQLARRAGPWLSREAQIGRAHSTSRLCQSQMLALVALCPAGATALHHAAWAGHTNCVEVLLEHAAREEQAGRMGHTRWVR